MTAEQVLQLHSEGFNRALTQQDYHALERTYSEMYMLVRPDGSVLNKQQVLRGRSEPRWCGRWLPSRPALKW